MDNENGNLYESILDSEIDLVDTSLTMIEEDDPELWRKLQGHGFPRMKLIKVKGDIEDISSADLAQIIGSVIESTEQPDENFREDILGLCRPLVGYLLDAAYALEDRSISENIEGFVDGYTSDSNVFEKNQGFISALQVLFPKRVEALQKKHKTAFFFYAISYFNRLASCSVDTVDEAILESFPTRQEFIEMQTFLGGARRFYRLLTTPMDPREIKISTSLSIYHVQAVNNWADTLYGVGDSKVELPNLPLSFMSDMS
jgi:hypothetical protein